MGKRTVVLVVALLLAGLSAFAIWSFLSDVEQDAEEGLARVPVIRATEFVERGASGSEVIDSFEESTELEETLPANAITTLEALNATLIGNVALGPISRGQVVTTDLWGAPVVEIGGLSELITPGFQALAIRPDEVRAVGGFIRPGDRINVIASTQVEFGNVIQTLRSPAGRAVFFPGLQETLGLTDEEMVDLADSLPGQVDVSQFILQDLEVLAVGAAARGVEIEPATVDGTTTTVAGGLETVGAQVVTLEVTAQQAVRLVFAQEYLQLYLTLVPEGFVPETVEGVILSDLIGLPDELVQQIFDAGLLFLPGSDEAPPEEPEVAEGTEEGTGGSG